MEIVNENRNRWILNGTVFIDGRFEKKDIRIENGKFAELAEPGERSKSECGTASTPGEYSMAGENVFNAADKYILPGLVDVHTHGRNGLDFSRLTEEDLQTLLASYAACGVTAVLGTTMTNEPSLVEKSLQVMNAYYKKQSTVTEENIKTYDQISCAKLLGIHMEGPFLGTEKKGAHKEKYLKNPDWVWLEHMQNVSGGNIRLVTVDPSLAGAETFIKKCREKGIKVSLGHTACDYETAIKAQQAGADHVTHLFNAMNLLHHREPGLIGAALDSGMYTELICDGIHVHPAVIRLMFVAHPEQILLVSDSISAAGMPEGECRSGGQKVLVKDGKATLEDGTIAGSAISLFEAMVNAIRFGVPAEAAVNSATYLPAKSVGMEDVAGRIAVGRWADYVVVDKDWKLEQVVKFSY